VNYFNNDGNATNGFNDGYAVSGSTSIGTNPFTDVGAYTGAVSPLSFDWLPDDIVRQSRQASGLVVGKFVQTSVGYQI